MGIVCAKSHGGTHILNTFLFLLQGNHGVGGVFIKLGGVGMFELADVAGKLDGRNLHTEADAKVGDVVFSGVLTGQDFSFGPSISKSTGDEDAIDTIEVGGGPFFFNRLGINPVDGDTGIMRGPCVSQ